MLLVITFILVICSLCVSKHSKKFYLFNFRETVFSTGFQPKWIQPNSFGCSTVYPILKLSKDRFVAS